MGRHQGKCAPNIKKQKENKCCHFSQIHVSIIHASQSDFKENYAMKNKYLSTEDIYITENGVYNPLSGLKRDKAAVPDSVTLRVLNKMAKKRFKELQP